MQVDELDSSKVGQDALLALAALNNAHAEELSYATPQRLRQLIERAFVCARIGAADALLLAFDQDADYDSENFLWFKSRFDHFIYVDRIVVAAGSRGRGYARTMYGLLFARAAAAGHTRIVCEVNSEPPNPASDAFHAALGFKEVGTGVIAGGRKTVRYFLCDLGDKAR